MQGEAHTGEMPVAPSQVRRLRVEEYHRIVDAGVFGEDEHLELLEGVITVVTPQSPAHARVIRYLTGVLAKGVGPTMELSVQLPLTLEASSEPEPDLAVVPAAEATASRHPGTALLVVEVARTVKAEIYARAAIPEYWIVDLEGRAVEVYRDPDSATGRYRTLVTVSAGELRASGLAELSVDVTELLARAK